MANQQDIRASAQKAVDMVQKWLKDPSVAIIEVTYETGQQQLGATEHSRGPEFLPTGFVSITIAGLNRVQADALYQETTKRAEYWSGFNG